MFQPVPDESIWDLCTDQDVNPRSHMIPTDYFLMQIDQTYCITMGNRSQAIDPNEILTCKYYWQEVYITYA